MTDANATAVHARTIRALPDGRTTVGKEKCGQCRLSGREGTECCATRHVSVLGVALVDSFV